MNANKKSSSELSLQRMTLDEIEEIRISAPKNRNQEMLAWSLLMEEVLHNRDILEKQYQACNSGDSRCNCANNGKNQ